MDVRIPARPTAWVCRTCGKVDWSEVSESLAGPEHVPYRGVDIGTCKGVMVPLYSAESIKGANNPMPMKEVSSDEIYPGA